MFEDDYDYLASLESKVWAAEDQVEQLLEQVRRLSQALMDAGVPAHMVELISNGG